jgi:hypothetical protein
MRRASSRAHCLLPHHLCSLSKANKHTWTKLLTGLTSVTRLTSLRECITPDCVRVDGRVNFCKPSASIYLAVILPALAPKAQRPLHRFQSQRTPSFYSSLVSRGNLPLLPRGKGRSTQGAFPFYPYQFHRLNIISFPTQTSMAFSFASASLQLPLVFSSFSL